MTCQWIIRGLVIALLCLCITGWVLSYQSSTHIYFYHDNTSFRIGSSLGEGGQFHLHISTVLSSMMFNPKTWLGFGFQKGSGYWYAIIPFWFPTLLSTALLWITWRTTRPKPVERGFPVDVT